MSIFFTVHLIGEKEKAHSSKCNTIIKKEGQKNKKNPSLNSPPSPKDSKSSSNQKSNKCSWSTSEITVSESESSLPLSFRIHSQTAKKSNITSGTIISNNPKCKTNANIILIVTSGLGESDIEENLDSEKEDAEIVTIVKTMQGYN